MRPGIRVQLRNGGTPLWTGILDSIPTQYAENGQHRATVTAFGVFSALREAQVQEGSFASSTTGQAHIQLLENINVCGLAPDSDYATMPRWWELGSLRTAIANIEDTEGGLAFEDRFGNIPLQSAGHRTGQAIAKTFTAFAPTAGQIAIIGRPQREIAVKDVKNEVIGEVREYAPMTGQTVFEREEPIAIGLGQTISIFADVETVLGETGAVSSLDSASPLPLTAMPMAAGLTARRRSRSRRPSGSSTN